jgi:hypothetical protein
MCFHKWSKWKIVSQGETYYEIPEHKTGDYIVQEKSCSKCGLIKRKKKYY